MLAQYIVGRKERKRLVHEKTPSLLSEKKDNGRSTISLTGTNRSDAEYRTV